MYHCGGVYVNVYVHVDVYVYVHVWGMYMFFCVLVWV